MRRVSETTPGGGTTDAELPGLDLVALRDWLASTGLHEGPVEAELIAGGRSNLTFAVDAGPHRWVLRRPPLGHVLATAHDMAREHRVISALMATAVPVPATVALCTDTDVLGAPFYLMQRVEGVVARSRADVGRWSTPQRHDLAMRMMDVLADLHAVDPESVGLGDLGRPDGYAHRQVKRWGQQLDRSRSRKVPGIDRLKVRLAASVPAMSRTGIVHGDYRLDNLVLDPEDGAVLAVLDWEMSTLGSTLTDVGLLLAYATALGARNPIADGFGPASGFPDVDELVARYAERAGLDPTELAALPWCTALGCFKVAVILEGIHYRWSKGQTVGEGFDRIGALVPGAVERGLAVLDDPASVLPAGA